jgi:hypothetical protein
MRRRIHAAASPLLSYEEEDTCFFPPLLSYEEEDTCSFSAALI